MCSYAEMDPSWNERTVLLSLIPIALMLGWPKSCEDIQYIRMSNITEIKIPSTSGRL